MDEATLRDLAGRLRDDLLVVLPDEHERARAEAELDAALALPDGAAKEALRSVIAKRAETRAWAAASRGGGEDAERSVPGLPGLTTAVGLHYLCPQGDFDRFTESAADDPGLCPVHGLRLVRARD